MKDLAAWAGVHLEPPDMIMCSPAIRTRQTLEQLQSSWIDPASVTTFEPDLYEATTGRLQGVVENAFRSATRLLIIGHNPGLEYLAHLLAGQPSGERVDRMAMGTLAVIEFPGGWKDSGGNGRVRHWLGQNAFD